MDVNNKNNNNNDNNNNNCTILMMIQYKVYILQREAKQIFLRKIIDEIFYKLIFYNSYKWGDKKLRRAV